MIQFFIKYEHNDNEQFQISKKMKISPITHTEPRGRGRGTERKKNHLLNHNQVLLILITSSLCNKVRSLVHLFKFGLLPSYCKNINGRDAHYSLIN